jgi:serine/threonine protein kinase
MYYKLLEKEYPFQMKKNQKNKWVYSSKKIRNPINLTYENKRILKKMLRKDPKKRCSISEIIQSLKKKLNKSIMD